MKKKVYIALFIIVLIAIGFVSYELLRPVLSREDETQKYAGIEIGASGIRYVIVTITKKKNEYSYKIEDEGEEPPINSDSFAENQRGELQIQTEDIKNTIQRILDSKIIPAKIPDENIFIASGSSYNKEAGNWKLFLNNLQSIYKNYSVEMLNETQESEMEMKTLSSPPAEIDQILLVGIGSRSTKLASYTKAGKAFARSANYGIRNLTTSVQGKLAEEQAEKNKAATGIDKSHETNLLGEQTQVGVQRLNNLREATKEIWTKNIAADLVPNNFFRSKKVIIVVGGVPCDILLRLGNSKEKMKNDQYSPLTLDSLKKFRAIVDAEYNNAYLENKNFEDENKGKRSECGRFTITQQVVGLEFIQSIFDTLNTEDKAIFFYERLTWLPGYLVSKAENKNAH